MIRIVKYANFSAIKNGCATNTNGTQGERMNLFSTNIKSLTGFTKKQILNY